MIRVHKNNGVIASMFAATVSMIDSELNVYAGVLTNDFFKKWRPKSSQSQQVLVGRLLTFALGFVVIWLALEVHTMGGAKDIILAITALVAGLTVMPVIWGLYSKKMNQKGVFIAVLISAIIIVLIKFGVLNKNSWFVQENTQNTFLIWVKTYARTWETMIGIVVPLTVLFIIDKAIPAITNKFISTSEENEEENTFQPSLFPARIIASAIAGLGALMAILALTANENVVAQWVLAITLLVLGGTCHFLIRIQSKKLKTKTIRQ